jgi:hypothetical protein
MVEEEPRKARQSGRIRDARGRSVAQLDPVVLHVWHRTDVVDREVLQDIVEELEPGTAKMRRRLIVLVPGTLLLFALGIALLYRFSDASLRRDLVSALTNPIIIVSTVFCGVIMPWLTARQTRLKRARFAMLKHRRCPHCGYDLRLLPPDPGDGATVCPECGCAWHIDDAALAEGLTAAAVPAAASDRSAKVLIAVALLLSALALGGALAFMNM